MINKLSKEKYFNYDSKELLGVMRFDFYDGRLANQWNPSELIIEWMRREIDLRKLQQELNYIQFELIDNFNNSCRAYVMVQDMIMKLYYMLI